MAHDLVRIDAERNVFRFYRLDIQPDLFGTVSLIREWGRVGQPGTVRIRTFADVSLAKHDLAETIKRKRRMGYRVARPVPEG